MSQNQIINSNTVYRGKIINLRLDTVIDADNHESIREIVEHSHCIAVVAIDENDRVLLVRQFREAIGKTLLEIPAGGIESGEEPAQAMQRELREETGYQANHICKMGGFYSSPGYSTEYLHLYLATGLQEAPLYAEDTSEIELIRIPIQEISRLIASGEISDAKSIAGLLFILKQCYSDESK